ncbi:MAG: glutamine synthetase family protein, partial [Spirochaetota bacterium]
MSECGGRISVEQLQRCIRNGAIDTVIIAFPDQFGQLMGKRLTGDYYLENSRVDTCNYLLTTDIEMEPQDGFTVGSWSQGYGDFRIAADPARITVPAWESSSALVLGDLLDSAGREVAQSPRVVLKRQIEKAAHMGLVPMAASELEFYLFRTPYETVRDSGYAGIDPSTDYAVDYHILGTGCDEQLLREIRNQVAATGIPVESSKGETGRGQYEVALRYAEALEAADRHVIYKWGVKTIAAATGRSATFMAKYTDRDAGSSCHLHFSLFGSSPSAGNLLWDEEAQSGTEMFRYFLGGLQALSSELFLFFAPTVNSYKRYTCGSFAPVNTAWDYDNRTTGFRVLGEKDSFRIENRLPGADANPYLAYAATLAAGLYGIEHRLECQQP